MLFCHTMSPIMSIKVTFSRPFRLKYCNAWTVAYSYFSPTHMMSNDDLEHRWTRGRGEGGGTPPLVQISTPTPPSGLEGTPPLFLSQGESFYDDTVKSPWRLDFGVFVHHLWKFSAAASLQFSFLTAMHDENRYQYYGLVLSNLENLTDLVWLGYMASSYTCCFNWLLFCNIWFSSMGIDFIWNYYNLFLKNYSDFKKSWY